MQHHNPMYYIDNNQMNEEENSQNSCFSYNDNQDQNNRSNFLNEKNYASKFYLFLYYFIIIALLKEENKPDQNISIKQKNFNQTEKQYKCEQIDDSSDASLSHPSPECSKNFESSPNVTKTRRLSHHSIDSN